jgi:hypothetical protein
MCNGVNGPALRALAEAADHPDLDCIDFFRVGAPLIGKLPYSHNGKQQQYDEHCSIDALWRAAKSQNLQIIANLKDDPHSAELMKQVCTCCFTNLAGFPGCFAGTS